MEIERKFLVTYLPFDLNEFEVHHITQGYISTDPVIRIRNESIVCPGRQKEPITELTTIFDSGLSAAPSSCETRYTLTVKGEGLKVREELNLTISGDAYRRLLKKVDGGLIKKDRYIIPLDDTPGSLICELDIFKGALEPLILLEIEFLTEKEADSFIPPYWFGEEVTDDPRYQNSALSRFREDAP